MTLVIVTIVAGLSLSMDDSEIFFIKAKLANDCFNSDLMFLVIVIVMIEVNDIFSV